MESEKYYGLGSDEYNVFKTIDNGKTWFNIRNYPGPSRPARNGRIIIYSNTNEGLKYSDDGLVTINDSNILDGNFKNIPVPNITGSTTLVTNNIYALNLDGKGIYESKDNGEYWSFVSGGTGDTLAVDNNGKLVIYGNGDLIELPTEKNRLPRFYPNSTFSPDGPIAVAEEIDEEDTEVSSGEGLIYILNKVLIPKLSHMLTGHEDMKYFKINNNSEMGTRYFTDGEVYKVDKNGIDWTGDVGMMPLTTNDIEEITQANDDIRKITEDFLENEEELIEELKDSNSVIYQTFSRMDAIINAYKEMIQKTVIGKIMNREEDYDDIKTPEGVSTMKMMYTVQKGAEASIAGTILNSIFTFDNSKKISLLRASIMETSNRYKGLIQSILSAMYLDVKNGNITKEDMKQDERYIKMLSFKGLDEEWINGLLSALKIYYRECDRNIRTISSDKDKKYIAIAANKYKEIREDLLDVVVNCVKKIEIEAPSEGKNRLYQLGDDLDFAVNKVTAAAVKYQALPEESRDKDALEKELKNIYDIYLAKESSVSSTSDPFALERVKEKMEESLRKLIKDRLTPENDKLVGKFYFDDIDYEEVLSKLSPAEREKVNKYYMDIINKFQQRCIDLMGIVVGSQTKWLFDLNVNMSGDLLNYMNKLKIEIDKVPYDQFYMNNNIGYISKDMKKSYDEYIALSKSNWINMREKI